MFPAPQAATHHEGGFLHSSRQIVDPASRLARSQDAAMTRGT